MKGRWIFLGIAIGIVVALTFGFGFASGRPMTARVGSTPTPQATGDWWAAMDAMHESAAMQRMHAQMPEELQAQCDAMHAQMSQMMGQGGSGMMGGSGGGAGPGMMGGSGASGGMMGW